MELLTDFLACAGKYVNVADFMNVYIEEAHPTDGWAYKNNIDIKHHKTFKERAKAAKILVDHVTKMAPDLAERVITAVDDMDDNATKDYGAVSERLYIILDGIVVYEGGRGPPFYHISEVEEWLGKYFGY